MKKRRREEKRRASVLSSLSLSWFSVIHALMSSVHAQSSLVRLSISLSVLCEMSLYVFPVA